MKVRVSRQANADLDEIFDYVAADKPLVAAEMLEALQAAMAQLAHFPHLGREGRRPGTRELLTVSPSIIIYTAKPGYVNVDRIRHAAQRR